MTGGGRGLAGELAEALRRNPDLVARIQDQVTDPGPVCPGCRSGDHQKCDEEAWDETADTLTVCACGAADHR